MDLAYIVDQDNSAPCVPILSSVPASRRRRSRSPSQDLICRPAKIRLVADDEQIDALQTQNVNLHAMIFDRDSQIQHLQQQIFEKDTRILQMCMEIDELSHQNRMKARTAKREADLSELFSSLETLVEMLVTKETSNEVKDNTRDEIGECEVDVSEIASGKSGFFSEEDAENIVTILLSCLAQDPRSCV
ncbi:hypothetical protein VKT23_000271 [Stygiomarasmius scandens]|uniref:Uncharacterized protein n=1 Tax=Marasmiellus scandens TaxID=2682957 RepID=A0ABR1K3T8_9AGAR